MLCSHIFHDCVTQTSFKDRLSNLLLKSDLNLFSKIYFYEKYWRGQNPNFSYEEKRQILDCYVYCTGFKYIFTLKVYFQRIVHLLFYLQWNRCGCRFNNIAGGQLWLKYSYCKAMWSFEGLHEYWRHENMAWIHVSMFVLVNKILIRWIKNVFVIFAEYFLYQRNLFWNLTTKSYFDVI